MTGLEVRGLTISLGGPPIVDRVDLTAPRGKITGLVGPNGAGKSTLIGTVVGLNRPVEGTVHFSGDDLLGLDRRARARLCAYVEQAATTEERLTVAEVVALGRIPFAPAWASGPDPADEKSCMEALSRLGMSAFAGRQFATLSGGEQQRVHMARALAQQPQLLLLDEPTSSLDIRGQLQVFALLRSLATEDCTVLMALHDLNLALTRCDWLVVMNHGRVVAEGAPMEVLTERLIADVYGVEARRIQGPVGPVIVFETAL
ncbi:hypothetical protein VW35_16865 [Devosia soli]|uniref:ABC transporter domain-containing protein n=1 Tax=Devosia soli TaxID=361041 RepID=A0A0F5L275_9HYPH|nr:ABC transporter ATP-binding protein [Devosia soli]KKB76473.1 hypothetical protein VW35_16865 [Devosia soli]